MVNGGMTLIRYHSTNPLESVLQLIVLILQVDPSGSGSIPAGIAAKFLKKSGLSDIILSRVGYHFFKC
jgi:hypothetical protein